MKTDPNVRMRMSVRTGIYICVLSAVALGMYKGIFERTFRTYTEASQTHTTTAYAVNGEPISGSARWYSQSFTRNDVNAQAVASAEDPADPGSSENSSAQASESVTDLNQSNPAPSTESTDESVNSSSVEVDDESAAVDNDYSYPVYTADDLPVRTILIDAGHGGSDRGDVASDGTVEKDVNLKLAKLVKEHLELQNPNLNVVMVREDDTTGTDTNGWEDLVWRRQVQEDTNPDYFISLHTHAEDEQSGTKFYYNADDSLTAALANTIANNLTNQGWSGLDSMVTTDEYPLQLISMANCHALMVEMGSLKDADDLKLLNDDESLEKAAAAIAASINASIADNPYAPGYQSVQKQLENRS